MSDLKINLGEDGKGGGDRSVLIYPMIDGELTRGFCLVFEREDSEDSPKLKTCSMSREGGVLKTKLYVTEEALRAVVELASKVLPESEFSLGS